LTGKREEKKETAEGRYRRDVGSDNAPTAHEELEREIPHPLSASLGVVSARIVPAGDELLANGNRRCLVHRELVDVESCAGEGSGDGMGDALRDGRLVVLEVFVVRGDGGFPDFGVAGEDLKCGR
jgi:hypothetical protein